MPILSCYSEITGHWEFNGTLNATIGQNLEWAWEKGDASFGTTDAFGISDINGKPANVLKFTDSDDISDFVGIEVPHGAELDEDSWLLHEYSIILDLLYPEDSTGSTRALVSNEYLGQAKIKINESDKVGGASFHGKILANTWHRVAIVVSHSNENITYYIDGAKVGEESIGGLVDGQGKHSLEDFFYLFTTNELSKGGYINSLQFNNMALPDSVISDLGGATAAGIPSVEPLKPYVLSVHPKPTPYLRPVSSEIQPDTEISVVWQDGQNTLTASSVKVYLNEQMVNTETARDGRQTTVKVLGNDLLLASTNYNVKVTATDSSGTELSKQWRFKVTDYRLVEASDIATKPGSLNEGFIARSAQAPAESAIRHDFKRATFQLAEILVDDLGDKVANEAIKGELEGGFDAYDLIDFEISGSAFGNFSNDDFFPGIPGSGDHDTLFATEILSYLELQKGVHTFGINVHVGKPDQNDEDQFRVFIGSNPRDYFSKSLGEFELTLLGFKDGPNDTTFDFSVEKDGLYPVRIVYWNKTRGAGLEFYSVDRETGGKILVNDLDDERAVKAFYNVSLLGTPHILNVKPIPGSSGNNPGDPIEIFLGDQSGKTDLSSIVMKINGENVEPTIARENGIITLTQSLNLNFASQAVYDVFLSLKAKGETVPQEYAFSFNVDAKNQIKVTGYWDFSTDLNASVGNNLEYLDGPDGATAGATEFGTTDSFELPGIQGEPAAVMKVGYVGSNANFGYLMKHGIAPNGGGNRVNQYTLIYDVYFTGGGNGWPSLANLDTSGDGDVFWRRGDGGLGQGGGGYEPVDPGVKINANTWHRVVLALDLASGLYEKYVDGVYHSKQNNGGLDGRQAAKDTIWLFNDNDGENGEAFVSSIAVYDRKLTADEAAILGSAKALGIPESLDFIPEILDLFFYQYAEGSSYNKLLEIHNPTDSEIDLSGYAFPNQNNGADSAESFDYWNSFPAGAAIAPGGNFIIAHPDADPAIVAVADHFHKYLSNGDDAYALVKGTKESYEVIDVIGDIAGDDPGSGWSVAGVSNATKDHTLTRKSIINRGNTDWMASAGTNPDDSEWVILDKDVWDGIESIPTISVTREVDGAIKIEFEGKLQSSANTTGPWEDIDANSPASITPDEARQFYRARN